MSKESGKQMQPEWVNFNVEDYVSFQPTAENMMNYFRVPPFKKKARKSFINAQSKAIVNQLRSSQEEGYGQLPNWINSFIDCLIC